MTRPASAVSSGVGWIGLAGLLVWVAGARWLNAQLHVTDFGGKWYALGSVAAAGVSMMLWSVFVDKVHRRPTTGINWDIPARKLRETLPVSLTRLAGLWTTWLLIGAVYWTARWYHTGSYAFVIDVMEARFLYIPVYAWMFLLSIPYIFWSDTRSADPHDETWAFGAWLMGETAPDWEKINRHLRAWAVKGFFLAFMIAGVPGGYANVVLEPWDDIVAHSTHLALWLVSFMFVIDMGLATTGYLLTLKPLDAHIRSATPYAAGWVAALICYPPFVLMGGGGPLDYHVNTRDWIFWLRDTPVSAHWQGIVSALMNIWCVVLVVLTGIYAWATMAFGIRFSNLTDRGILTHGPYAFSKHPAYLSKNLFWWLETLPFIVTSDWKDAVRNTIIMACVSGVYYWRARTEEWHLRADPVYRDYEAWMNTRGAITRRLRRLFGF
ncbi:MAG: protein-S-isoprenylcysteine methyltransferase [Alphaproteobacteria bacterium]|nr:protein-S-isoprenylcysteine methyltransferase [Alphaproteobacteria bacterium]